MVTTTISSSIRASVIACVLGSILGCTTTDPNTGEQKASNTTKGGAAGALAGAVLGAMTSSSHDRGKGALIGAAAGGLIGAGVGNYQDRQEAKLKERMANAGVQVRRDGDNLNVIIPGNISFASGSAALTPSFYPVLDVVAKTLSEYPETQIQIVGYTDSTGAADLNQRLSQTRAAAVSLYLGAKGVLPARLQAQGLGPSNPITSNTTSDGRAQNRRVELKIIPTATRSS